MNNFIPVSSPLLEGNEKKYLCECIDTGWISSEGGFVKRLEMEFSNYCGQKFGIALANGSGALDIAVRALKETHNWSDYDEIIVPSFTIISCAQSVIYNKLKPVFVDADPLAWTVDVNKIEEVITFKTKAIMAVHIYGLTCDIDPILELAKKYNLKIIEDSAQAHGQEYKGKKCGGFGDVSTFSFYANKHIATGEGGMIMTSDENIAAKSEYYRNLCFTSENRFVHNDLGWNYRISNLQAAVGVAQLEQLDKFIKIKKKMGKMYQELLGGIPAQLPLKETPYCENSYWVFGLVLNEDVKFNAKEAMRKLAENGIGTRPFFYPLHSQPVFKKLGILKSQSLPVSEKLYERGFYIPSGLTLTGDEIEQVAKKVKELF